MIYQTTAWLRGKNIYEVNIRQYTPEGSFNAFAYHLPRLKEMGIDILWFMPITPISVKERKGSLGSYYAAADYQSVNPEFGTITDFCNLVNTAHKLGFKIIIDWVANHTGWDHSWTRNHPDFYLKDHAGNFTERNGWEDVIDLDYSNIDMQAEMIKSMQFWVESADIDGFRCDMAMLVSLDFWHKARTSLDKIKELIWLGECEDPAYHEVFDISYAWEWMHRTAALVNHQSSPHGLKELLDTYAKRFPSDAFRAFFTSNHDENSWNGTEYERYKEGAKAFSAISMLLPQSIPLIYSGQELPILHRLKFFDKDEITWDAHLPALHDFYRVLLNTRKQEPVFLNKNVSIEINSLSDNPDLFSIHLYISDDHLLGIFNLSGHTVETQLKDELYLDNPFYNLFTNHKISKLNHQMIRLIPWDFKIYLSL